MSIRTPNCNSLAEIVTYPWSLAVDHCEKASLQTDYQWVHYTLAALEYIPLVGALVALVELVALSVFSCCFSAPTPAPAATQPKRPWKFVPLNPPAAAAPAPATAPGDTPAEPKKADQPAGPPKPPAPRYIQRQRAAGGAQGGAAIAAFEQVFANKFQVRPTLIALDLLPPSLVNIIYGYVSSVSSRPRPEPKPIEDLQLVMQLLYNTSSPGHIDFDISIQLSEGAARKSVPGPTPNLIYALDLSGSMAGSGISTLEQSIPPAIRGFPDDGRQGVYTFASDHREDFALKLRTPQEKEEMATRIGTGLVTRGGTELKPSTQAAICALTEASIQDRIDNVEAPSVFIPCTDGDNDTPWSEGEVSQMFDVVDKYAPEVADNIRIFPVGMGNGIKYSELRTLATSRGEVSKVRMGHPEELRAVIDKILLQRGILLNQGFITLNAPIGCTIASVEGYQITEGASVRLPIVSLLDGDRVRLTGRMKGKLDTNKSLNISFVGFDQIARRELQKTFEQPLAQGNNPHVAALVGQTDYYRETLQALLACDKDAAVMRIQQAILHLHLYHSDWITKLMSISSDITTAENPQEAMKRVEATIKDALERLPNSGKTKRTRHTAATIDTAIELERRGLFRRVTRDQVAKLFKEDGSLKLFFRFTSSSDRHLVLCWPNPAKPDEPYEQLLKVEAPIDGSAPRFIHDNDKMQVKKELAFASLDLLLNGLDKYMADSTRGI